MENWLKERLSICLNFEIPPEMAKLILDMKTSDDVDDYFTTLLNYDLPEHRLFINDFKQRQFGSKNRNSNKLNKDQNRNTFNSNNNSKNENLNESSKVVQFNKNGATAKTKTKYVNLYTQDGDFDDTVLLKGRHRCDCQASKHKLINNCMTCGRIVCKQEGSGPCLFCGSLVCTEEETKAMRLSTKKSEHLKKSLMDQNRPKGWEEALAQRNRLLEYDRTSERRTTVIDDESDYFSQASVWLSDGEKKKLARLEEEMREQKHASRLRKKVTIDFAGREVTDEPSITVEYEDKILREIAKACDNTFSNTGKKEKRSRTDELPDDIHPGIDGPAPIYIPPTISQRSCNRGFDGVYNRVQDKELLEMQDMSHCMSMHQPWASLLIAGIKKHEGRSWYTAHRGRLWIASTAKPVDIDELKRMENFYRVIYNDDNIIFPSQYSCGSLLGCVSVQDCLPQEEYRKQYPEGESDAPFVFICTNPQELPIKFPIKGMHKIYKLDKSIHTAAVKSLQRIAKLKAEGEI